MFYDYEVRQSPFSATKVIGLSPKPHIHPHLELIYLSEGKSTASVDGQDYLLQAGDLLITFPSQIHFYHDITPIKGKMFIVHPDLFSELYGYIFQRVPLCPVITKSQLTAEITVQIEQIYSMAKAEQELEKIASKGLFICLLAQLLQIIQTTGIQKGNDTVREILLYCMAHYTHPLSLDELAAQMHLSKCYLSHIFKKRLNLSFPEFVNGLRVEHACRMLTADSSVTEVAYASGFSSIRSFNRNFERHTGFTPTEFIRTFKK